MLFWGRYANDDVMSGEKRLRKQVAYRRKIQKVDKKMDKALKGELTCPVCMELFSNPLRLGCGHSYCRKCLLSMERRSDPSVWDLVGHTSFVRCPECRRVFDLPSTGVDSFPADFKLSKLVDVFRKMEETYQQNTDEQTSDKSLLFTLSETLELVSNARQEVEAEAESSSFQDTTADTSSSSVSATATQTAAADVTSRDAADVTPCDPADVTPRDTADVTPRDTADVTPRSAADVTPRDLADVIPRGAADVTPRDPADVTPRDPADVVIVSDLQETGEEQEEEGEQDEDATATMNDPVSMTRIPISSGVRTLTRERFVSSLSPSTSVDDVWRATSDYNIYRLLERRHPQSESRVSSGRPASCIDRAATGTVFSRDARSTVDGRTSAGIVDRLNADLYETANENLDRPGESCGRADDLLLAGCELLDEIKELIVVGDEILSEADEILDSVMEIRSTAGGDMADYSAAVEAVGVDWWMSSRHRIPSSDGVMATPGDVMATSGGVMATSGGVRTTAGDAMATTGGYTTRTVDTDPVGVNRRALTGSRRTSDPFRSRTMSGDIVDGGYRTTMLCADVGVRGRDPCTSPERSRRDRDGRASPFGGRRTAGSVHTSPTADTTGMVERERLHGGGRIGCDDDDEELESVIRTLNISPGRYRQQFSPGWRTDTADCTPLHGVAATTGRMDIKPAGSARTRSGGTYTDIYSEDTGIRGIVNARPVRTSPRRLNPERANLGMDRANLGTDRATSDNCRQYCCDEGRQNVGARTYQNDISCSTALKTAACDVATSDGNKRHTDRSGQFGSGIKSTYITDAASGTVGNDAITCDSGIRRSDRGVLSGIPFRSTLSKDIICATDLKALRDDRTNSVNSCNGGSGRVRLTDAVFRETNDERVITTDGAYRERHKEDGGIYGESAKRISPERVTAGADRTLTGGSKSHFVDGGSVISYRDGMDLAGGSPGREIISGDASPIDVSSKAWWSGAGSQIVGGVGSRRRSAAKTFGTVVRCADHVGATRVTDFQTAGSDVTSGRSRRHSRPAWISGSRGGT
ncbi:uncharacterized protein LOC121378073 [Gigantopelta aegis]|uniref:uncharacterized protein LOC121378073 n=1 Tax=Gigantopelta aegis TaxID=1735272 RepID=UPI001B88BBB2|nr:uncharacterized protein LOC121378073 [Gigantopelta aegis]